MSDSRPIDVIRKDGVLVPRHRHLFDRAFVEGQDYTIEVYEPRSAKSQDHYHAAVREAWKNLPEGMAERFADADQLRKFALIRTGWGKESHVVCAHEPAALELAAIVGRMDASAVVTVDGTLVTIVTAKSQRVRGPGAMDRHDFQKSKQDVLDYVASLIGVDAATLSSQVSNSSGDQSNDGQANPADAPAGNVPHHVPAGATIQDASSLSDDWRSVYIQNLSGVRDRPASLNTRHTDALQMIGGEPNRLERAWMNLVRDLVRERNEGHLRPGIYDIEINRLERIALATLDEVDAA